MQFIIGSSRDKFGQKVSFNSTFVDFLRDNYGKSIVHYCVNVEQFQLLKEKGVNLNAKDNKGKTVVHHWIDMIVIGELQASLIPELLAMGVDIDVPDEMVSIKIR